MEENIRISEMEDCARFVSFSIESAVNFQNMLVNTDFSRPQRTPCNNNSNTKK